MKAAKQRFSNVQRYAPTASRKSSSETYLICQNKLPRVKEGAKGKTAYQQVQEHLEEIDVLVKNSETDETPTAKGFRKLKRKED